jgi:hypothetical protein
MSVEIDRRPVHQNQRMGAGSICPLHQIESDSVIIPGASKNLKPENVRSDRSDFLDRRATYQAKRVRNSRRLCSPCQDEVCSRQGDSRTSHRRDPDRRRVAPAKKFDLGRRSRGQLAITRHQLHRIERGPVTNDAFIGARAPVRIFECEPWRVPTRMISHRRDIGKARTQLCIVGSVFGSAHVLIKLNPTTAELRLTFVAHSYCGSLHDVPRRDRSGATDAQGIRKSLLHS